MTATRLCPAFIQRCVILVVSRKREREWPMPAAVKIKAGKYGTAIGLLLEHGGAFQTRHERTLIVNAEQKKALEQADLVESSKRHANKKGAG